MSVRNVFFNASFLVAVSLNVLNTTGVRAQSTQASPSGGITAMGEITVTARKRQESILNVPVIATVISQAQLEKRETLDLKDVAKFVPGLTLSQTLGVSGVQVSLRGVGTNALNAGIDASVSLNIDGLQVTQGIAYGSAMFDLGQIEVLKGPQALFFGKNSPGGVISLRSADPTDRFEAMGRYGYEAEGSEHRVQAVVSGPVSESLRLRLAAQYDKLGGYLENNAIAAPGLGGLTPRDRSAPNGESYVIRGTVILAPSDQFDARLKVNLTNDRLEGGAGNQLVNCPDGTGPVPPRNIQFFVDEDCKLNRVINLTDLDPSVFYLIDKSGVNFNEAHQKFGTLELNYRPWPDITLTSVTGYYRLVFRNQQSVLSSFAGPGIVSIVDPTTRRDVTQELRVDTDFDSPWNFTAGGFYQDGKLFNVSLLSGNTALGLAQFQNRYEQYIDIESVSAFGQVRWKIIPALEIAGGARWSHETRELTAFTVTSGAIVPFPTAVPKITADNVSPEATISYKPTDDITLFGSYKQGFKSGSFQVSGLTGVRPDRSFGDEKVEGWEIGAKAQLLDGRLFTNIAFYDYRYSGLQVGVNLVNAAGLPTPATLNAGSAKVYGVDFDFNYLPEAIDGLRLNGSIGWNHARFSSLVGVPCWGGQMIAEGCNQLRNPNTGLFTAQDLTGQPLTRAPTWQANFGFDYEMPLGNDMTLALSNSNQYSGRYQTNLGLRDDFYMPAFFKSDITVAVRGPNDRWEFALVTKNISDKITTGGCSNSNTVNGTVLGGLITGGTTRGPAGVDERSCYTDRGREIWLRATWRPFN